MKRSAVYPGTFDPITNGHQDLVRRAAGVFERVIVAIASNPNKAPMFPLEKRVELARLVLGDIPGVDPGPAPIVNSMFPTLPPATIAPLQAWSFFWDWDRSRHQVRWMAAWDTDPDDVATFATGVRQIVAGSD